MGVPMVIPGKQRTLKWWYIHAFSTFMENMGMQMEQICSTDISSSLHPQFPLRPTVLTLQVQLRFPHWVVACKPWLREGAEGMGFWRSCSLERIVTSVVFHMVSMVKMKGWGWVCMVKLMVSSDFYSIFIVVYCGFVACLHGKKRGQLNSTQLNSIKTPWNKSGRMAENTT